MTTPTPPLSSAAQAVKVAIDSQDGNSDIDVGVAVLIAAADQVVPVDRGSRRQCNIRRKLLALAAELRQEGQP